ncbi:hypothetical protein [Microcoleus sp. OTE_8_concoct_300]|uniref:hypothetical protein n=1 Tax=Microcoleus sp. OTE_8_concoct_300 TaxID=2964710 RepID=UPI00403F3246
MWCARSDRPYQTKVRSPATTKSFQRKEYHTAARSLLKCDRAYLCKTPQKLQLLR